MIIIDALVGFVGYVAPIFLVMSPLLSYGDQAHSMHKKQSSEGFSIDIPLIMLVASFLKSFYWLGSRFDTSLLLQALVMIAMQLVLLKVALDNRVSNKNAIRSKPFHESKSGGAQDMRRPWDFWQWHSSQSYWDFILAMFSFLTIAEIVLGSMAPVYDVYSNMIGYVGLAVEALLPVPQILTNRRAQSCKGFRASVIANWLFGDAVKIFWFFTSTTSIPWSFKLCALFQSACDFFLALQFLYYGTGEKRHE